MKLNPVLPQQSSIQQEEDSFHQQIGLKLQEEANEMLHLEHCIVWWSNLDTSKSRSEICGKFWNVVLEKDGEGQLGRSRNKEVLHRVKGQRDIL